MSPVKKWDLATRLETITLAVISTGLGSSLAIFTGKFSWVLGVLAMLIASLLQIICNLANDYGDFLQGADLINQIKPPSAIQMKLVTLTQVRHTLRWGIICVVVLGVVLLYWATLSWISVCFFSMIGVLAVVASMTYTLGNKPYGYQGWGDIAVFTFFGLVGVGGTYYLHTQQCSNIWLLPAVSCGSLAVGLLNVNNIRDLDADMQSGKYTIPVRIGRKAALYYHWSLLTVSVVAILVFLLRYVYTLWPYTCLCTVPWLLQHGILVSCGAPAQLTEQLQSLFRIILVFAVLLSAGIIIECFFAINAAY